MTFIQDTINDAQAEYDTFTPDEQEAVRHEFEMLKRYTRRDILLRELQEKTELIKRIELQR
jgi:hypothetical protein